MVHGKNIKRNVRGDKYNYHAFFFFCSYNFNSLLDKVKKSKIWRTRDGGSEGYGATGEHKRVSRQKQSHRKIQRWTYNIGTAGIPQPRARTVYTTVTPRPVIGRGGHNCRRDAACGARTGMSIKLWARWRDEDGGTRKGRQTPRPCVPIGRCCAARVTYCRSNLTYDHTTTAYVPVNRR